MEPGDFQRLVTKLVRGADQKGQSQDTIRSSIQTLGSISRSAGFRLADCMSEVVPVVVQCARGKGTSSEDDEDDELRENCFQTLESLLVHCPATIGPHLSTVESLCVEFVAYDPNYNEEADGSGDEMDLGEDGSFDDFPAASDDEGGAGWAEDDEIDYSDDEDISWKVRKAASKALGELIRTRPELTDHLAQQIGPLLVRRFTEREETVKLDIFQTFSLLLNQIRQAAALGNSVSTKFFEELTPNLVSQLVRILGDKKDLKSKVRIGVFHVMRDVLSTVPRALAEQLSALIPFIQAALTVSDYQRKE